MGHRKCQPTEKENTMADMYWMIMNFHGIIPRQRQSEDGEET